MEGFFMDVTPLRCYGPLDDIHAFKPGPLDGRLEIGEKSKSQTEQDQVNRQVFFPVRRYYSQPGASGCEQLLAENNVVSSCIVVGKQSRFVLPQTLACGKKYNGCRKLRLPLYSPKISCLEDKTIVFHPQLTQHTQSLYISDKTPIIGHYFLKNKTWE